MSVLADWLNLLYLHWQVVRDDPNVKAAIPIVPCLFGLVYAILLVTDGFLFPVFLAIGFALGASVFAGNGRVRQTTAIYDAAVRNVDRTPALSLPIDTRLRLFYPPLTAVVDKLIDYFCRDFILHWWTPLNTYHNPEFERTVRGSLNGSVQRIEKILMKQERNDIVMATLYGVANVLIIHMRECRNLECSGLSLDEYTDQNPQSPFAQLLSEEEQHNQMLSLSTTILKRVLPTQEVESAMLLSLLRELLASHLFGNILNTISDPDFINTYIIAYLAADPGKVEGSSVLEDEPGDGIRSVVARAAESLMAAAAMDETAPPDSSGIATPASASGELLLRENTAPGVSSPVTQTCKPAAMSDSVLREQQSSLSDSISSLASNASLPPIPESALSPTRSSPSASKRRSQQMNDITNPPAPVPAPATWTQAPMIYEAGTVLFSIQDISAFQQQPSDPHTIPEKSKLMFIIQIERPALEDHAGSEGGGYVITRTYIDFEVFHAILCARHSKRIARANLRLPLDPIRSWLKLGSNSVQPTTVNDPEGVCRQLERYLQTVIQDQELGRDQIILAFLRKERRGPGSEQVDVSFADEYMDEVGSYAALSSIPGAASAGSVTAAGNATQQQQSSVGKAISMLARAPSLAVKSVSRIGDSPLLSGSSSDEMMMPAPGQQETQRRWFTRRPAREGSISSNISSATEDEQPSHESESAISTNGIKRTSIYPKNNNHLDHTPPSSLSEREEEDDDIITEDPSAQTAVEEDSEKLRKQQQQQQDKKSKPLSSLDIELLIETTFALVVEIFDLTTANNKAWMRRTLLNVLREIVRRSYTEIIAEHYSSYMQDYMSPDALVHLCDKVLVKFWPNGRFGTEHEPRTDEQKEHSRAEARTLLMSGAVPGGVRQLIGDQNTSAAMERLWRRVQHKGLNRVLMLQLVERIMRPIFG